MASYVYTTTMFRQGATIGVDQALNAASIADFEGNFKAQALGVASLITADVSFIIESTYAELKSKIDGVLLTWADVRYIQLVERYILYLVKGSP